MLRTPIGRFSLISLIEGVSLLVLLLVAVPVKYIFHHDSLVKVVGPIHGGMFLLYLVFTMTTAVHYKWNLKTVALLLLASVIPFGNFYCDYRTIRPQIKKLTGNEILRDNTPTVAESKTLVVWLKRIGITGFLFFLIKGLVWIAVFAGAIKGCS